MHADLPIMTMGIGGLGPWELGLLLVIVLIVFGAGKLPSIGAALGQALRNFKKSAKDGDPGTNDKDGEKK